MRLIRYMALLLTFVAMLSCSLVQAEGLKKEKQILYISSYSNAWATVPSQIQGLKEALGKDYALRYEFMDTKRTVYGKDYQEFYQLLKVKLASRNRYEGIIVADDAALAFINRYHEELFPGVKVAFTGIDNVEEGLHSAEQPWLTGVVEKVDYKANLEMAAALFPKAKRICFIFDNMENGIGILHQLQSAKKTFVGREVVYIDASDYTKAEMEAKMCSFTKEDIVFCATLGKSKGGILYTESERNEYIKNYCRVPVLCATEMGIGQGFLGGYVIDQRTSAKKAGEMLRAMLEQNKKLPVELHTPHTYMFDYEVLQAHRLSVEKLDRQSNMVLVNKPPSFLELYHNQVVIGLLTALCAIAILLMLMKHRQNEQLAKKNAELEAANKLAEAANDAKTIFLNNMSHDIRTPMNAILGFAKLMEKDIDKPEVMASYIGRIKNSGEYLLTIINGVLDMARIESGKTTIDLSFFDFNNDNTNIVNIFEDNFKAKNLTVKRFRSIQHPYILADTAKTMQIMVNLLSNAVKYTPSGGTISIGVEESPSERPGYAYYTMIVADTGIGMSKEFQEIIFDSFTRERNTTSSKILGTGLGMSIVKKLVDLMGGTIELESELGKGTTFRVKLEHKLVDKPEKYTSKQLEKAVATEDKDFSGKRILLAEDNPINAEIAMAILEEKGFVIEHAEDGVECVDLLTKAEVGYYDAILMDIQMPNMDGYEAAITIRRLRDKAKSGIPILAMTANAFEEDRQKAFEAGMDGFCTKPIEVEQLNKELARVLK